MVNFLCFPKSYRTMLFAFYLKLLVLKIKFGCNWFSFAATAGCDQPFSGERSGDVLHVTSRRLHCRPANERAQLRRQIFTANTDGRTEQHMVK